MERSDEIWTEVEDFPTYQVSSYGNVYNAKYKRILKPRRDRGYLRVTLVEGLRKKDVHIHRLVAQAFMLGFHKEIQLEHVDGNLTNNRIDNLKPRGGGSFRKDAYQPKHIRGEKVYVLETGQVFQNAYSMARHFRIDPSSVYKVLRGERRRVYGMRVRYLEDDGDDVD